MRKLTFTLMLLLLLPFMLGINSQADETVPPPNPGVEDDGGGDITGDHPWGGDDNVVVTDPEPDLKYKETISFTMYLKLFAYSYLNIDLMGTSKFESTAESYSSRSRLLSTDRETYSYAKRSR